ncbi:MAG: hypothetical protein U5K56_10010 [Halioglobus sp.]|nr:hypothetical protein [Halioglobus sp.]
MKRFTAGIGFFFCGCAAFAAAQSQQFSIEAPVVSVTPQVRHVTDRIPHQSCWEEQVRVERRGGHRSAVPPVLGAIIGGAAAGAIGDNSGHQGVIAGAGAALGAAVGRDVAHRRHTRSRYVTEERCEIDYELREREVVSGYRVGYEYGDDVYYTQTRHRPGPTIRVEVILEPESY